MTVHWLAIPYEATIHFEKDGQIAHVPTRHENGTWPFLKTARHPTAGRRPKSWKEALVMVPSLIVADTSTIAPVALTENRGSCRDCDTTPWCRANSM